MPNRNGLPANPVDPQVNYSELMEYKSYRPSAQQPPKDKMIQLQKNLIALTIISTLSILPPCLSAHPYKALVAPITKDSATSLYSITLNFHEKYVIDLGGPFLWYHCPKQYPSVLCSLPKCIKAQSYNSPVCPKFTSGVGNYKNQCSCVVTPANPVTKMCALAQLTYNDLIVSWTDGHIPKLNFDIHHLYTSCAPQSLFKSLPIGSSGMAGLSRSPLALPMQLTPRYLQVRRQFALCLPGDGGGLGVSFFGEGPFYLMSNAGYDLRNVLTYTPLLKRPRNPDYYIDVRAIAINGEVCKFLARVLEFDSLGHGGVKLSTIVPYTTLRSHIYRSFIRDFAYATRGIPRAKKVKPFQFCLNTENLGSTRVGLLVPQIDLMLDNGMNWTIFGSNSMKQVSENVACLAIVDGGERAEEAVVIGSFQMENNFLLFDLQGSTLGFSSSLFFIKTTCNNFNFTSEV